MRHFVCIQMFKFRHHPDLSKDALSSEKWLRKGSPVYHALKGIVFCKYLLFNLKFLVKFNHTGELEVYHSLYNKYCPKCLHFSYAGMVAKSQLAVFKYSFQGFSIGRNI